MRRLFSEYGLFATSVIASVIAISLFVSACFSNDVISLSSILETWINHLI